MQTLGRHALLDLYGCDPSILDDQKALQRLLHETALALNCTVVQEVFHTFAPHGVSGVVVIAESHLAIHTWPEHGYAAVDLFTCNETTKLQSLSEILSGRMGASHHLYEEKSRGVVPSRSTQRPVDANPSSSCRAHQGLHR